MNISESKKTFFSASCMATQTIAIAQIVTELKILNKNFKKLCENLQEYQNESGDSLTQNSLDG